MDIALTIPSKINSIQEAFLLNQPTSFNMDRPVQAWQWMTQSRSVPDYNDWVRTEVIDAWHRCLKDYQLPLGNYANWDEHLMPRRLRQRIT